MDNYHITKKDKKWEFKKQGAKQPTETARTKEKIIQKMQNHMSDKTGSVKIHKKDGPIQEERTYQRKDDPKKTPG
jgi:hypothetical protein